MELQRLARRQVKCPESFKVVSSSHNMASTAGSIGSGGGWDAGAWWRRRC